MDHSVLKVLDLEFSLLRTRFKGNGTVSDFTEYQIVLTHTSLLINCKYTVPPNIRLNTDSIDYIKQINKYKSFSFSYFIFKLI